MARFYGTVQGQRGRATRIGRKSLHVSAQSYSGDILVNFYIQDDVDRVTISAGHHNIGNSVRLYDGPVADLLNKDYRRTQIAVLTNLCGEFLGGRLTVR